jgi:GNAT superfamily N-acetyltransferase
MEFRAVETSEAAIETYVQLFGHCFPKATHYSAAYLSWLYRENPAGLVVGFDAFDGNRLAAHYVCIPAPVFVYGVEKKSILSLNTATHPDYQGKGLFTKLASKTYERAASEGFEVVFGVANANSTPGFVRRLGFQNVERLLAAIGIGAIYRDSYSPEEAAGFRRAWSTSQITWRLANPVSPVACYDSRSGCLSFAGRTGIPGLVAWAERKAMPDVPTATSGPRFGARLFIGKLPKDVALSRLYVPIPARLRPSPLNLIHLSLTQKGSMIDPDEVFFDFLDFDAF